MPETLSSLQLHEAKYYRQCKRCFMTGKACIYQRNISQVLRFSDESINTSFTEEVNGQVLTYSIDGLCRGAIHRSLAELVNKSDSPWANLEHITITVMKDNYVENDKSISFKDVEEKIRNSTAIIICTSKDEPCSYFWLGFAHGLEKDVVPITALPPKEQSSSIKILYDEQQKTIEAKDHTGTQIIPFDMRALWHIYFYCDRPKELENQIHNILEIIANKDKDTLYRRQFWQPFLDEGSVSIFVGSVELTKNKRHVVGEWDYRTVSELSSFFTSIKETMETVIQTPIFQASTKLIKKQKNKNVVEPGDYAAELASQLMSRNSIVIASADVNDMTEVALSTHAGVEPFNSSLWKEPDFDGIVAFKGEEYAAFPTPSLYFQSLSEDSAQGKRGFYDVQGGQIHEKRTYASKYLSYETKGEKGFTEYYGHIAKFKLPNSNHWTVVLQGITGPATLGLAQLLTGGIHEQFTIFDESIAEETRKQIIEEVSKKSRSLEKSLLENEGRTSLSFMRKHSEKLSKTLVDSVAAGSPVEAIIKIYTMDGGDTHHDERRIVWWDIEMNPRTMAKKNI